MLEGLGCRAENQHGHPLLGGIPYQALALVECHALI
jgi:hypothetical protein